MILRGLPLSTLKLGQSATLEGIAPGHPMRKRLLELGFIPGARVRLVRAAPLGDPIEVVAGGAHLALRRRDLEQIFVEPPKARGVRSLT